MFADIFFEAINSVRFFSGSVVELVEPDIRNHCRPNGSEAGVRFDAGDSVGPGVVQ